MSEYETQAQDFLNKTNTTLTSEFAGIKKHFPDDKEERAVYKFTLTRGSRSYSGEFGTSLKFLEDMKLKHNSLMPALVQYNLPAYNILACLTKYDPGTFENFCSDYGYDVDSRAAEKIYNKVLEEWAGVQKLWTDEEIELLQEIQ